MDPVDPPGPRRDNQLQPSAEGHVKQTSQVCPGLSRLASSQGYVQNANLAKARTRVVLIQLSGVVGLACTPPGRMSSPAEGCSTFLGHRLGCFPEFSVGHFKVCIQATWPALAHDAFFHQPVAKSWQNASIQPINGLKPLVMPVVVDGDVVKLLLIRENWRFLSQLGDWLRPPVRQKETAEFSCTTLGIFSNFSGGEPSSKIHQNPPSRTAVQ